MVEEPPERAWWVVAGVVGVLIAAFFIWTGTLTRFDSGTAFGCTFGLALTVAGVALYVTAKSVYHLVVMTNGGQVRVLSSQDMRKISTISAAIMMAIVERK